MRSLCNYGIAIIAVCAICCATVRADVDLDTIEYNLELRDLREVRIEKFGGYYLGGKIKLPLRDDYDEQFNNSDWVDHGGVSFRYDEKRKLICMADSSRSSKSVRLIMRQTVVTPKTRLVQAVGLDFMDFSENIETLYASLQDEIVKAVGFKIPIWVLEKFMEDGKEVEVDNGKQLLWFHKDDETKDGIRYTILGAQVIDLRSVDAERAYVQAQKDKQQKELQRWIDDLNSRPPFTSFCGIEFGTRLTGDLERTENGRYLCGYVELDTPFRGCDIAKVYAGVKTHRIFRVEIATRDSELTLLEILEKKYHSNGNPAVNADSYLSAIEKRAEEEYLRPLGKVAPRYQFGVGIEAKTVGREARQKAWSDLFKRFIDNNIGFPGDRSYNLNGGCVEIVTKDFGRGEVCVLKATSYEYQKVANDEYEKESGGDGSGVL